MATDLAAINEIMGLICFAGLGVASLFVFVKACAMLLRND